MIEGISNMTQHGTTELAAKMGSSGSALIAVVSAIDGNSILSLGAAIVAVACLVYRQYRDQVAKDHDQARYSDLQDAINEARIEAIKKHEPDPYPNGMPFEAPVNKGAKS